MHELKQNNCEENLYITDEDELEDALNQNIITRKQYDDAYKMANRLISEIQNGTNVFINRGLTDYLSIK